MRASRKLLALTLLLPLAGCGYNRIQELDERAEQARADIGVQLQARNQLIPNMVATVRGAADFERGTQTEIARARAGQLAAAEQQLGAAGQEVDQAVQTGDVERMEAADALAARQIGTYLNIAVEAYPQLSATRNFQGLQDQLAESENRIAVARQDYNATVQRYNAYIRKFPQVVTARLSGADRKDPYRAPAGAEQAPTVDFGGG